MMTQQQTELERVLQYIVEALDITPTDYQRAVASYMAVGNWLKEGYGKGFYSGSQVEPEIYPQGSINLGTIVRPIREGMERDFDVDLVCELQVPHTRIAPKILKDQAGACLRDNSTYRSKMDPEGKRCWTLTYAESAGSGFHIDVLPCVHDFVTASTRYPGAIIITNKPKATTTYEWLPSNPKGYATWFKERNTTFNNVARMQKQAVFDGLRMSTKGRLAFASVADVPDQLVRTPLQRSIQLMKRHRDMCFADNPDFRPISIIITTVAATLYQGENDIQSALAGIAERLALHTGLLDSHLFRVNDKVASLGLITRTEDGKWRLPNPANPYENFADRWHEDNHARARAFFDWVCQIRNAVLRTPFGKGLPAVAAHLNPIFGERASTSVISRIGESLRESREKGSLRIQSGTGILGATGNLTVKPHNFYGH